MDFRDVDCHDVDCHDVDYCIFFGRNDSIDGVWDFYDKRDVCCVDNLDDVF